MGLPHGGENDPVLRPFVAWLFVLTLRDFSRPLLGRLSAFETLQIEDGRCDLGSEPDSYHTQVFPVSHPRAWVFFCGTHPGSGLTIERTQRTSTLLYSGLTTRHRF